MLADPMQTSLRSGGCGRFGEPRFVVHITGIGQRSGQTV